MQERRELGVTPLAGGEPQHVTDAQRQNARAVAFRFTPVGSGAAYQIDDVYLDPWKDR